jgi:hypothetical protein
MKHLQRLFLILVLAFAVCSCGDKKDAADRNLEAQKAIQEGLQKEKQMYEGMQKGVDSMEKKMQEQKEEPKK